MIKKIHKVHARRRPGIDSEQSFRQSSSFVSDGISSVFGDANDKPFNPLHQAVGGNEPYLSSPLCPSLIFLFVAFEAIKTRLHLSDNYSILSVCLYQLYFTVQDFFLEKFTVTRCCCRGEDTIVTTLRTC